MADKPDLLKKCFALTGSIASGKSLVASMLSDMGAHVIDTDLIAREVVEPGQPALKEIAEKFGTQYIRDDGTLDRDRMRDLIISDASKKEMLNSITHPRINEVVLQRIKGLNEKNDGMPIIIDVPLLYEARWDRFFPDAIVVYVPVAIQVERLMKRDSLDREKAEMTVAAQMDIEEKRSKASFVIDNSGTIEETGEKVRELFSVLRDSISGI